MITTEIEKPLSPGGEQRLDESKTGDMRTEKVPEVSNTSGTKKHRDMLRNAELSDEITIPQDELNANVTVLDNIILDIFNEKPSSAFDSSGRVPELRILPMSGSFEVFTEAEFDQKRGSFLKIIDAPCGRGKTSWAIQFMKANWGKRFLFVTPFLTEVARIKTECAELDFVEPSDEDGTKINSLKKSLIDKRNIVSTHNLFSRIDEVLYALLKTGEYTLILDETMDVMHQVNVTQNDLNILKEKFFLINETSCLVSLTDNGRDYKGKLREYTDYARQGRLHCFGGTVLIWQLPLEVFTAMKEMYLLTYLFSGQIQKYYFDFHKIHYHMYDVRDSKTKGYYLAPYDQIKSDEDFRIGVKDNLNVYEGKLNRALKNEPTYSWYRDKRKKGLQPLQKATCNYFTNKVKGNSNENMWTTFKDWEKYLKGGGYTEGFIPHNTRATNEHAHKKNLAYLIDRRLNPGLVQYFRTRDVVVDEELFAISELVQWVFRSAIRKGEPVNLYLPSDRMRGLLYSWMDSGCAMQKAA